MKLDAKERYTCQQAIEHPWYVCVHVCVCVLREVRSACVTILVPNVLLCHVRTYIVHATCTHTHTHAHTYTYIDVLYARMCALVS